MQRALNGQEEANKMKKLSVSEVSLLELCLQRQKKYLYSNKDINALSAEQYNQLRDVVCDELIANGFSSNGEVNEYGKRLENLIDSLGRFFM